MALSPSDALRLLPQRGNVLLIDQVVDLEPGKHIRVRKAITRTEPAMQGQPEQAFILPPGTLLDLLVQTAALLLLSEETATDAVVLLSGCEGFRLNRLLYPGDLLDVEATIEKRKEHNAICRVRAVVEDQLVVETRLQVTLAGAE